MAAPAQTAPDPRARTATGRLLQGFAYPFRAVGFMFRHGRLLTYALVPILISLVLLSALFVVLVYQAGHLTGLIWHRPVAWYAEIAWYGLYVLVFAGTFVVGALALPALIASPFNDTLSERAEGLALGTDATQKLTVGRLVRDVGRVLADQSIRILLLLLGHAVILLVLLIPAAGSVVYPVLATLWSILWCAADYLDYPMGRHAFRFRAERRVMRENFALTFGFGAGVYLILLIPVVNALFVPVAVVGGTLLYADLLRAGALPSPPPR
jgi:CysZ protein